MLTVGLHTLILVGGILVSGGILIGRHTEYKNMKKKEKKAEEEQK